MAGDLHYITATEAIRRFSERSLSPVELMSAVIARAEAVEPRVNALPIRYFDEAMAQAKRAEVRYAKSDGRLRPLEGLPVAVKDEAAVEGRVTTQGSMLLKDNVDHATNPSIDRVLRAGAIMHARSATPEFCCAGFTYSKLWGVTRNPWNPAYSPGGSSGGAGASLASGTTVLATGSDIGGSIRIPASACGVVGFKPPYGRNPDSAPYNLDWYNHIGPMARTVADCALLQNVMAGPHPGDIATIRPKLRLPREFRDIKDWKVAYSLDLDIYRVGAEVRKNTLEAVAAFRGLGCQVDEVTLGWTPVVKRVFFTHLGAIMGAIMRRHMEETDDRLCAYTREFLRLAGAVPGEQLVETLELEAEIYARLAKVLRTYRVLLCPTLAIPAVLAEHDVTDRTFSIDGVAVEPYLDWAMTPPFNILSRCPVLAVPTGRASSGVPTGLQIVGRPFDDLSVFRAGAALEQIKPWLDASQRRPSL